MMKWLEAYFLRRAAYLAERELNRMSDRQLEDIGILRADIPKAVRKGLNL